MSETERLPEPEPEIPDLPHLWMALESISILGMPMCRRLVRACRDGHSRFVQACTASCGRSH